MPKVPSVLVSFGKAGWSKHHSPCGFNLIRIWKGLRFRWIEPSEGDYW